MAADFRCEQCGNTIRADVGPGQAVVCPYCSETVLVPAGLASLPQPNVAPNAMQDQPTAPTGAPPPVAEEELPEEEHNEAVMGAMAAAMPWMISVFLHVALALILFLFVVVVINPVLDARKVMVPNANLSEDPGGSFSQSNDSAQSMTNRRRVASRNYSRKETGLVTDAGKTSKAVALYDATGGASGGGAETLGLAGGSGSPDAGMYGSGGNAHDIVYVIDRSGSMVDSFNLVKRECASSIGRLSPVQDVHIILFSEGPPLEPPAKRLVPATDENKVGSVTFLKPRLALAKTDPIPALRRAFSVLAQADRRRPGKLMFLLTDGVFPDNEQVLQVIESLNVKKDVHINTLLYGNRPPVAVKVMKAIAAENGGRYKFVQEDQ